MGTKDEERTIYKLAKIREVKGNELRMNLKS